MIYFNSTMVRLKVGMSWGMAFHSQFQFHYGSIKSEASNHRCSRVFNFNSTMVRLKVDAASFSADAFSYFNSTMVRLKAETDEKNEFVSYNFNSTMVRLKVRNFIHFFK